MAEVTNLVVRAKPQTSKSDNAPTPSPPLISPELAMPGSFPSDSITSRVKESLDDTTSQGGHARSAGQPTHGPSQPSRLPVPTVETPRRNNRNEDDTWSSIRHELTVGKLKAFATNGRYLAPRKSSYLHPAIRPSPARPQSSLARRPTTSTTPLTTAIRYAKWPSKQPERKGSEDQSSTAGEETILKSAMRELIKEIPVQSLNPVNGHISADKGEFSSPVWNLMKSSVRAAQSEAQKKKSDSQAKAASETNGVANASSVDIDFSNFLRQSQKLQKRRDQLQQEDEEEQVLNDAFHKFKIDFGQWQEKQRKDTDRQKHKGIKKPTVKPPKVPKKEFIREPSEAAFTKVPTMTAMKQNPGREILDGRNPIAYYDLLKVLPESEISTEAWLNDNAINAFFGLLCEAADDKFAQGQKSTGNPVKDNVPRYAALNTQWYPKMISKKGYDDVKRWAKRAKFPGKALLKLHRLFIPIHLGNHWVLLVINPQTKTLTVYDSLGGHQTNSRILSTARNYLWHELGEAWNEDEWTSIEGSSSTQANGSDCGVYTCFNALATFYGEPHDLIPDLKDLLDARKTMAAIFVNGGFQGEFNLEEYYSGFSVEAAN
jgi:sentrin-specific protease 1